MNSLSNVSYKEASPRYASNQENNNRRLAIRWLMNVEGHTNQSEDSRSSLKLLIEACPLNIQALPEVQDVIDKSKYALKNMGPSEISLNQVVKAHIAALSNIEPPVQITLANPY
ncbi:MAG TPA: hypothetical protein DCE71_03330 [Parachlamydiales bacterium]|nr:hypothetical protein [Parachlamydiales bacterium]